MTIHNALVILKLLAVLLTGIFGLIGLLVDYKDRTGRITRGGRWALIGVVLSTVVAVASQAVETKIKSKEDSEAAEKTLRLLTEIRYPFRDAYVTANMLVPRASLPSYFSTIDQTFVHYTDSDSDDDTIDPETGDLGLNISKTSKLFPKENSMEWNALANVRIEFCFYKTPIDTSRFKNCVFPKPDLHFVARTNDVVIQYYNSRADAQVLAMRMEANPRQVQWRSNGKIASLGDLSGSQLIVCLENSNFEEASRKNQLLSISLDIGGRPLFLGSGLKKLEGADVISYSFLFSKNLSQVDDDLGQDKSANGVVKKRAIDYIDSN